MHLLNATPGLASNHILPVLQVLKQPCTAVLSLLVRGPCGCDWVATSSGAAHELGCAVHEVVSL